MAEVKAAWPKPFLVKSTPAPVAAAAPAAVGIATPSSVSLLPAPLDLTWYAGDDFAVSLTLTDSGGSPIDLTGAVVIAQIRPRPGAPIAATFTSSITGNRIDLSLLGTATQSLSGAFAWDCQVTYGDGTVSTVAAGTVKIVSDISR
jgi:hypothetical protein